MNLYPRCRQFKYNFKTFAEIYEIEFFIFKGCFRCREEVELLSMTQTNVKKKGGFTKLVTGMFDTIYFEHLLAFAMKTYSTGNKLILIASSEDEFIYLRRTNTTHVYINP